MKAVIYCRVSTEGQELGWHKPKDIVKISLQ